MKDFFDKNKHDIDETQFFEPTKASTPYHGGEQHEMQTMMDKQSGLPSYDERTPLLSTSEEQELLTQHKWILVPTL